jgi:membrane-associated phospholipid phosphatase
MPRPAPLRMSLLAIAAGFVALAIATHGVPYFPIDLAVTRALQGIHAPAWDRLMRAESWVGYSPQSIVIPWVIAAFLFVRGMRRESIMILFAACGALMGEVVKRIVHRSRPPEELVTVVTHLASLSFPSGHVVWATTMAGFLAFVATARLRPSPGRRLLVGALLVFILLMGPSRIYLGEHWVTDTLGGYLFGVLWLALSVEVYRRIDGRAGQRRRRAPEPIGLGS